MTLNSLNSCCFVCAVSPSESTMSLIHYIKQLAAKYAFWLFSSSLVFIVSTLSGNCLTITTEITNSNDSTIFSKVATQWSETPVCVFMTIAAFKAQLLPEVYYAKCLTAKAFWKISKQYVRGKKSKMNQLVSNKITICRSFVFLNPFWFIFLRKCFFFKAVWFDLIRSLIYFK